MSAPSAYAESNAILARNTPPILALELGQPMTWSEFVALSTFAGPSEEPYDFHKATRYI